MAKLKSARKAKIKPETKALDFGIGVIGPTRLLSDSEFLNSAQSYDPAQYRIYSSHPWVFSCVRSLATNIASVPVKLQIGSKDNPEDLDDTSTGSALKLFQLFNKPNSLITRYQLFEYTVAYLNLCGSAYWILDRQSITDIPKVIYVEGNEHLKPVFEDGQLKGWLYTRGKIKEALTTAQVLAINFFNPYEYGYGLAPLEAARRGITLDLLINNYNRGFFESNADPGGILTTDKRLSPQQAKEILNLWEQRHRSGNTKRIGIVHSGTKYQGTSISQKDMEFIEQKKLNRDEILATFKVPKTELSMYEDQTYANAVSQDRSYWQKTLIPIAKNIEAVINHDFLRTLAGKVGAGLRMFFDFDSIAALQDTLSDKIQNAVKLYAIGYPINLINNRLNLGMPKVPWGDLWYGNSALASIEDIIAGTARATPKPFGLTTAKPTDENTPAASDDQAATEVTNEPSSTRVLGNKTKLLPPYSGALVASIKDFKTAFETHLYRLRRHQLSSLVRQCGFFDKAVWDDKLINRLKPFYARLMTLALRQFKVEHLTCRTLPSFQVHETLMERLTNILVFDSLEKKLQAAREIFNEFSKAINLEKLAKLEVLLTWCEFYKQVQNEASV